ncbi:MAG: fluoride efflux transporter CrcB [Actinomycetota bacterium]|nr:fluoride efflux transporter CrcB [Actinomycetota bacterium]
MTFWIVLSVAAGGFVGAPTRFLVDRLVADQVETDFPAGTFVINMSGAFCLGLLTGLGIAHHLPGPLLAFLGTGFCGAYTTFSTWSYETIRLLEEGEYMEAALNAFGSLFMGLVAAGGGIALGLLH